jgi:NAD(P)-dependent dehydrogenase (short-subunit alcohol dehydrogenase family)
MVVLHGLIEQVREGSPTTVRRGKWANMRLEGKAAFITGGSSGIGLATAMVFVREGARVAITGRGRPQLDEAVEVLGRNVIGCEADVDDDEAMGKALEDAAAAFGGIDVVFANAGSYRDATLGSATREVFSAVLATNVIGVFMTVQQALPHLRHGASIIITGSTYSTMGPAGASAYAASKAAVASMARVMASELSPRKIRVNVVVPGAVNTPSWHLDELDVEARRMHEQLIGERALLDRMLTAEEVANAVLFLASDESSGIQAAEIVIDGGTTGAMAGSPRFRRGEAD